MDMTLIDGLARALTAIGWAFLPLTLLPILYIAMPKTAWLTEFTSHVITLIDGISYRIGEVAKWLLVVMIIATVIAIIALSIFGVSYTKLDELPIYMHASIIMLGASATLLAGEHVRVDIFHSRYSPKRRAFIDLIGFYLFIVPVCLILLWMSQSFIAQSWTTFEGSKESNGIKGVYLLKTLIPAFAVLMYGQGLSITARAAMLLRGDALPARPEGIPPLFEDVPSSQSARQDSAS